MPSPRVLSTLLIFAAVAIAIAIPVAAAKGPNPATGNNGVPSLLAEIDGLFADLTATTQALDDTTQALADATAALDETTLALGETTLALGETTFLLGETTLALSEATAILGATLIELSTTEGELLSVTQALVAVESDRQIEARTYRVPQTGQVRCFSEEDDPEEGHVVIPCANTYQDADHLAGLAPPFVRFVDNGNGTITDEFTNLVWMKRGQCIAKTTWQLALDAIANLQGQPLIGDCNLADGSYPGQWRVPNVHELMSILDFDNFAPALPDGAPFLLGDRIDFWTSTTYALPVDFDFEGRIFPKESVLHYGRDLPRFSDAFIVNLQTGEVNHRPKDDPRDYPYYHSILAVRDAF